MTGLHRVERSVLYGQAWFVPLDEFTGRVRTAGVAAELDRFDVGGLDAGRGSTGPRVEPWW